MKEKSNFLTALWSVSVQKSKYSTVSLYLRPGFRKKNSVLILQTKF